MDKTEQPTGVEGGEGEVPAEPCKWCAKGNTPKVVDDDGTLVSITGRAGTLSHCYEEYWWPCLRFGIELHTTLSTSTVAQPTPSISDQAQRAAAKRIAWWVFTLTSPLTSETDLRIAETAILSIIQAESGRADEL